MPKICKWKFFERLEYKKKEKKRKTHGHAAGKKDAGGDEKLLILFTRPLSIVSNAFGT